MCCGGKQAMNRLIRPALFALPLLLALTAAPAQAQRVVIGLGNHGHHGGVALSAAFSFGQPRYSNGPIRVVQPRCEPAPIWVPGHYEEVSRRVYTPGRVRQEYVPAVYEERHWRDYRGCWHIHRVMTCAATWRTIEEPGAWQVVCERVWVEGSWRKYAS